MLLDEADLLLGRASVEVVVKISKFLMAVL
jgi:hypothetical protein